MSWQPIETAPKDGTQLLLRFLDQTIIGHWSAQWGHWVGDNVTWYDGAKSCVSLRDGWGNGGPSAWTHLPEPPK